MTSNNGYTIRATSADEIIFNQPIGPENRRPNTIIPPLDDGNGTEDNWQGTGFTRQQQTALQGLLGNAQAGPPGLLGLPGPQGADGVDGNTTNGNSAIKQNAAELGFFDLFYDGKSVYTSSTIDLSSNKTYFWDIYLFIECAKDLATVKGAVVRQNLQIYLYREVIEQYIGVLSEVEKRLIKYGVNNTNLSEQARVLVVRFIDLSNITINAVLREYYFIYNAGSRREPREYA